VDRGNKQYMSPTLAAGHKTAKHGSPVSAFFVPYTYTIGCFNVKQ
jgi:hypothetical protein